MRVALLSPIHWRTPPRKYGSWELVTSNLAEGLVANGVDVTLFATGDSITRGQLAWVCPRPLMEDGSLEYKPYEYLHTASVFERAPEFDLIHNHYNAYPLTYSRLVHTPVVSTIYGLCSSSAGEIDIYRRYNQAYYVSISQADRRAAPDLNYVANVYPGIAIERFEFVDTPGDYLVYLGRISPQKGVDLAIQLAKRVGMKILLAGLLDPTDTSYFEAKVRSHLDGKFVHYLGEIGDRAKAELLGGAYAFVHMVEYPEGFGIPLVESMACGTPVIARNRGSISEVVAHGRTGFIVETLEEAEEAFRKIGSISRKTCRSWVEEHFTQQLMVEQYLRVYHMILGDTVQSDPVHHPGVEMLRRGRDPRVSQTL